jgi:hypothetical protein
MPYPAIPTLTIAPKVIEPKTEDIGIMTTMDDGKIISGASQTESPLIFDLEYKTGYADMETSINFYRNTVKGSSSICTWTNKDSNSQHYNQTFDVRIVIAPEPKFISPWYWEWKTRLRVA